MIGGSLANPLYVRFSIGSRGKSPFLAFILGLSPLFSATVAAQTVLTYPGSVEGRITCNDGGFPARNAFVSLVRIDALLDPKSASRFPRVELAAGTDYDGNYTISGVPAGEYVVSVRQAGYIDELGLVQQFLNRFPPDKQKELLSNLPQVIVRNGPALQNIVMMRGAAISGRVTFSDGGAMDGARIRISAVSNDLTEALRAIGDPGPFETLMENVVTTDDRGFYRIAGLPKGKYKIVVLGRMLIFAPGVVKESEAKLFSVDEGDEISDADVTIPMQLFHSISGIVMRGGNPVAHAFVTIRRQGDTETDAGGETKSDGLYRFPTELSGSYIIEARYPADQSENSGPQVESRITVQLGDSDVDDANIELLSHAPAE